MTADTVSKMQFMLSQAVQHGSELHIDLWYPPHTAEQSKPGEIQSMVIGLQHVRAADEIRVSYDFVRNGWIIEQASKFEWNITDVVCDRCWKEVSFLKAWGSDVDQP